MIALRFELSELDPAVEAAVAELVGSDAVGRLWSKDFTLFGASPDDNANRIWRWRPSRSWPHRTTWS